MSEPWWGIFCNPTSVGHNWTKIIVSATTDSDIELLVSPSWDCKRISSFSLKLNCLCAPSMLKTVTKLVFVDAFHVVIFFDVLDKIRLQKLFCAQFAVGMNYRMPNLLLYRDMKSHSICGRLPRVGNYREGLDSVQTAARSARDSEACLKIARRDIKLSTCSLSNLRNLREY